MRLKPLLLNLLFPLAVGGLSALISGGGMETFQSLNQPPLSPPGWLFPIVWTILFLLMGIASYLVSTSDAPRGQARFAKKIYAAQLIVNFFWPILFFNLQQYLLAFFWLILLWVLILKTLLSFYKISKPAGYLLLPYLLWVTFAGYLNLGVFLLNR
ncbi:MAG: tryptophan-rich sensory protein [Oscillospiraceae bacterium]|nr:tryptophan-rich sensory protein [Oscillospiraceae bacterium]